MGSGGGTNYKGDCWAELKVHDLNMRTLLALEINNERVILLVLLRLVRNGDQRFQGTGTVAAVPWRSLGMLFLHPGNVPEEFPLRKGNRK